MDVHVAHGGCQRIALRVVDVAPDFFVQALFFQEEAAHVPVAAAEAEGGGRAVGGHLKLVRRGGARVDEYVGVAAAEEGGEEEGEEQAGFLHVVCSLIGLQRKGFPPISPTVQSNYQHTEVYASGAGVSSAASPSAVVVPLERCL